MKKIFKSILIVVIIAGVIFLKIALIDRVIQTNQVHNSINEEYYNFQNKVLQNDFDDKEMNFTEDEFGPV